MRDYIKIEEVIAVVLEMCEDVAKRARDGSQATRTSSLGIDFSKNAFGRGVQQSRTIHEATNDTMKIYNVCLVLLNFTDSKVLIFGSVGRAASEFEKVISYFYLKKL